MDQVVDCLSAAVLYNITLWPAMQYMDVELSSRYGGVAVETVLDAALDNLGCASTQHPIIWEHMSFRVSLHPAATPLRYSIAIGV